MVTKSSKTEFSKQEIGCYRVVLYSILLFAISNILQKASLFDIINKLIIVIICLVILVLCFIRKQSIINILIILMMLASNSMMILFPVSGKEGLGTYFTFPFWVLFLLFISDNTEGMCDVMRQEKKTIELFESVFSIIVLISMLFPSSWEYTWGEGRYFTSFSNTSFELAPASNLVLSINLCMYTLFQDKKKYIKYAIVPIVCVVASGARTYFVVLLIQLMMALYIMLGNNASFYIGSTIALVALLLAARYTGIGSKFAYSLSLLGSHDNEAFYAVFTNGRSDFWRIDIQAFLESPVLRKLFGNGFSYVYDINEATIGNRIYAHNDWLNILLNFGIFGFIPYLLSYLTAWIRSVRHCDLTLKILILMFYAFNAMFNMVYVYAAAVMSIGLVFIAASHSGNSYRVVR